MIHIRYAYSFVYKRPLDGVFYLKVLIDFSDSFRLSDDLYFIEYAG